MGRVPPVPPFPVRFPFGPAVPRLVTSPRGRVGFDLPRPGSAEAPPAGPVRRCIRPGLRPARGLLRRGGGPFFRSLSPIVCLQCGVGMRPSGLKLGRVATRETGLLGGIRTAKSGIRTARPTVESRRVWPPRQSPEETKAGLRISWELYFLDGNRLGGGGLTVERPAPFGVPKQVSGKGRRRGADAFGRAALPCGESVSHACALRPKADFARPFPRPKVYMLGRVY